MFRKVLLASYLAVFEPDRIQQGTTAKYNYTVLIIIQYLATGHKPNIPTSDYIIERLQDYTGTIYYSF